MARPYPYGPPVPESVWRISHAKSAVRSPQHDGVGEGLEHAFAAETELEAEPSELSVEVAQEPDDASTAPRPGVFGFDDHDRHQHADPDIGWNLPS